MKKIYIIIGLAVLLLVPIIVNFICLSTVPCPIIGEGTTWLSFFGSYLGGVVTALITLYVLCQTLKSDRYKKEYEIQLEFFNHFCNDLAELVTLLNLDDFSFILLPLKSIDKDKTETIRSEISRIDSRIKTTYNGFFLKYGHIPSDTKNRFVCEYCRIADFIRDEITEILECVGDIEQLEVETPSAFKDALLQRINTICEQFEKESGRNPNMLESIANQWKKEEYDKVETLKTNYLNY